MNSRRKANRLANRFGIRRMIEIAESAYFNRTGFRRFHAALIYTEIKTVKTFR
jgi:hypothetical protein